MIAGRNRKSARSTREGAEISATDQNTYASMFVAWHIVAHCNTRFSPAPSNLVATQHGTSPHIAEVEN